MSSPSAMSFQPASTTPTSFGTYTQPVDYSSASDIEAVASTNYTDYSENEAGYSSTASASFEFAHPTYRTSNRIPGYAQTSPQYSAASSQSPPAQPFATIPPASNNIQSPPVSSSTSVSPIAQTNVGGGPGQQQYQRIARFVGPPPVALACTECRSRHLKCDAGTPSCTRCMADKRVCSYIKSRRGWKGTRRKKATPVVGSTTTVKQPVPDTEGTGGGSGSANGPPSNNTNTAGTPPVPAGGFSPTTHGPQTNPLESLRAHHKNSTTFPSPFEPTDGVPPSANLMQLYYTYFHAAHPFILPPAYMVKTPALKLTVLLPVMRYVASIYSQLAPTENFHREAEAALFSSSHPSPAKDPFTVQALLLFCIGLHGCNEPDRAAQVKDIAVDLALELGMNHSGFTAPQSPDPNIQVLEESYRRTWWELYYIDGLLATLHPASSTFRLWNVECTVPLPCEESLYAGARVPPPASLQSFDDRYFSPTSQTFSSFAYRVEAVRILGQVLFSTPETEETTEASLSNWALHLPKSKKQVLNPDKTCDEMCFQAHVVINLATIHLTRNKSQLLPPAPGEDTTTTNTTPEKDVNTTRCIMAANNISKLLTIPTPLVKHTPFLAGCVTAASIVHLSAVGWLLVGDEGFLAKERVRLAVGVLGMLEEVWPGAAETGREVRGVAREVFKDVGWSEEEVDGAGVAGAEWFAAGSGKEEWDGSLGL